ncbi:hypothetical protein RRG08_031828 [Elysia crispata]|uniref:Uncharacterized protein n=1 Tax=Elysia crispata TaxID=231223 RepID=A0AAE0Y658_9GAST|nr:hypothetical protein RRG08_031828 [Elysia crispata]
MGGVHEVARPDLLHGTLGRITEHRRVLQASAREAIQRSAATLQFFSVAQIHNVSISSGKSSVHVRSFSRDKRTSCNPITTGLTPWHTSPGRGCHSSYQAALGLCIVLTPSGASIETRSCSALLSFLSLSSSHYRNCICSPLPCSRPFSPSLQPKPVCGHVDPCG